MKELIKHLERRTVINLKDAIGYLKTDMAVYRLEQLGKIKKVYPDGLGYFTLPETEEGTAHFAIVNEYYSQCVISGKTALSLYGLSLDYIGKIDVDISNKTNLVNELLNVHRVTDSKINYVEERSFKDKDIAFKVKIYSVERCLHEAYKYYKGSDSFYIAIKKYRELYLNRKNPSEQFDKILEINRRVGQEILNLLKMGDISE